MSNSRTIEFQDVILPSDGFAIVTNDNGVVAVCISLKGDGDIEIFIHPNDCRRIGQAMLEVAAAALPPSSS